MATCRSCGGIIGRDCFNPMDCAMISASEDSRKEYELMNLRETVNRLIEILDAHGINVDGLKHPPAPTPDTASYADSSEDLPF